MACSWSATTAPRRTRSRTRGPGPPCNSGRNGCYAQAEATGKALADARGRRLAERRAVPLGPVSGRAQEFSPRSRTTCSRPRRRRAVRRAPGVHGRRMPTGRGRRRRPDLGRGTQHRPRPAVHRQPRRGVPGPDAGRPVGDRGRGCPSRPNPPVPTWHAYATYRFQAGLADDMIGYENPAWAFSTAGRVQQPGPIYTRPGRLRQRPTTTPAGHHHNLETEAVGPTAANMVAENSRLCSTPTRTRSPRSGSVAT